MPKTKISEYSATANSNTDVASINIDEGCAPSGINNAIRAVMGHLKDFQQGTNGDPFNGPVNGTLGATTASTADVTTLTTSSTVTHNGGTANGVGYLNASKVLTTGSALVFDGSKLGVGTSTLNGSLTVKNPSVSGNQVIYAIQAATSTSQLASWDLNQTTDVSTFGTDYGASLAFKVNSAEKMRLDTSGNLGIGATSFSSRLFVESTTGIQAILRNSTASGYTSLRLYNDLNASNRSLEIDYMGSTYSGGEMAYIGTTGAYPLTFATSNTERARIDSSGNLLVGTTSTSPGYGNTNTGAQIGKSGSMFSRAAADYVISVNQNTADGGTYYQIVFRNTNGAIGSITSTSTVCSYNSLSDYRLKNTIAPITGALAKVALLKPCTYKWNADGSTGEGFIAHELAEVCPQAVTGEKDAVDADGNNKYQGIDTSFLVATLTAAIQELKAEFDAYKASHP